MPINKDLLLQLMLGVGAEVSAGGQGVQAANLIGQQHLGAKGQYTMMDVFQKFLAGEGGEGSKMGIDSKGVKMQFDTKTFGTLFGQKGGEQGYSLTQPGGPSPANVPVPKDLNLPTPAPAGGGWEKLLNPSSSQLPDFPDVAGIGSADVSNALTGALGIEGLNQKKLTDLSTMINQASLTGLNVARTQEIISGANRPLQQDYPINVPGVGTVTRGEWNNLPTTTKEYAAYRQMAEVLGDDDPILSQREFENEFSQTERGKFLRDALKNPEIMAGAKELATAGASQVNVGQDTLAREQSKQQAYVTGPKMYSETKAKLMKDKKGWRATARARVIANQRDIPLDEARLVIQRAMIRADMDAQIRAAFLKFGKVTYVKGKGWYLDGTLIREDL